jgi:hypothetical protein
MTTVHASKLVRPFWGRATVIESPVDETERQSGLIVPHRHEGDDDVRRGVILDIDRVFDDGSAPGKSSEQIDKGMVVYFQGGVQVLDVIVLRMDEIVAFEAAE